MSRDVRLGRERTWTMRYAFLILAAMASAAPLSASGPGRYPTQTRPQRGDWTARDHIPFKQFIVQSHRGAGEMAPENTLEAFELGWKLGTWPEADVRTTKDGVIVAFHDATFERVVRKIPKELAKKGVKDVTFEELSRLDVGAWKGEGFVGRHVSKINDVLALMQGRPERHLYLDIKNVDLPQLAKDVLRYEMGPQVVLASTDYEIIREWNRLVPKGQTQLWMGGTEDALRKRIDDLRKTGFAGVSQLQIHVHLKRGADPAGPDPFMPSSAFLVDVGREARSHGIVYQVLPWGVTDPKVYWRLLDLGVMSFATDRPDITLDAVARYYAGAHTSRPVAR
ncbi:MAG: glycerophosphodiester phosphodiesterase [Phycisphaerae bacterium]